MGVGGVGPDVEVKAILAAGEGKAELLKGVNLCVIGNIFGGAWRAQFASKWASAKPSRYSLSIFRMRAALMVSPKLA